tara:strand:+ start:1082 stop:2161 length:1080 start_codon:yes stop_codon:yes gene_type:complete
MKQAVHFGAGNIGRGFIAPTLQDNDYDVIFVDVNIDLIKQINDEGKYNITSIDIHGTTDKQIQNIKAVSLHEENKLKETLLNADLISTSVGPQFVEDIFRKVAHCEHEREQVFIAFENMYRASSNTSSKIKSLNPNLNILDAVVDKIVPPQPTRSLDVVVETYGSIILDELPRLYPLETSEIVSYKDYENEFYKKLWLLNGLHLQLAYFGLSNKNVYINEIIENEEGKEFAETAVRSLSEAYSLFSRTDENLDNFCKTIINRFALPDIKDEVARIARNPEIKFAKNERFEYPLRLLIKNNSDIATFKSVLDIVTNEDFENVDGFSTFKQTVLTNGKTNIYNKFWEIEDNISAYIERLGS